MYENLLLINKVVYETYFYRHFRIPDETHLRFVVTFVKLIIIIVITALFCVI